MTPEQFRAAEAIFLAACERPTDERAALVADKCAGDALVRDAALAMLEHDRTRAIMLDSPLGQAVRRAGESALMNADTAGRPRQIGAYRILDVLGEGGFGIVYLAEQENPRRTVALKVLRGAMNSPDARRRFEFEAQILGRLRHPGIAQVYEAGVAESAAGRQPYIAMELVRGTNIVAYVESEQLKSQSADFRAALNMFMKVCEPIEYAHRSGVIHRDLKPENILIDEHQQPKVLDFGIARLTSDESQTALTAPGQLLGTLAYMSPEQVVGDPEQVDSRADVYALGVVLYRLLSGRLPLDLSRKPLGDALQMIREADPPPLGTLDRRHRGDIQAIVARAMEKDPNRRYPSVAHLSGDVRAYLEDRPISARNVSTVYYLQRFVRRNRALAVAGGVALAGLVLGGAGAAWQAARATHERDAARAAVRKTERVNKFLRGILGAADPNVSRGREVGVREMLDNCAARIEAEFGAEPELESSVRTTIGETYLGLGRLKEAEEQLARALSLRRTIFGESSVEVAETSMPMAKVLHDLERVEEGQALSDAALEIFREKRGEGSAEYLRALTLHADFQWLYRGKGDYRVAEREYLTALAGYARVYGQKSEFRARVLGNLGGMYMRDI